MNEFILHTHWRIAAPVETVWRALHDVASWPSWWRYVERVEEIACGDAEGVGAIRRLTWTSRLPYTLTFAVRVTEIERPRRIAGSASGDLQGIGIWTLAARGEVTHVHYEWRVGITKPWMRALAPLLRPLFAWNHGAVMAAGERGLRRLLCHVDGRPQVCPGQPVPSLRASSMSQYAASILCPSGSRTKQP